MLTINTFTTKNKDMCLGIRFTAQGKSVVLGVGAVGEYGLLTLGHRTPISVSSGAARTPGAATAPARGLCFD